MKPHSDSESLLSDPGANSPTEDKKIDRKSLQVEIHDTFDVRKSQRQFSCQYAHSYAVRLQAVTTQLENAIKLEWPGVHSKKIAELCEFSQANANSAADDEANHKKKLNGGKRKARDNSEDHGQHIAFREDITVAVYGTIFKYQPEKPSILQELAEDNPFIPVLPKTKFTSSLDTIKLEDETARVQLAPTPGCALSIGNVVNGIVCACKGRPNANGTFEVEDIIYPSPREKPLLDMAVDFEMIFVSGLEFGRDCQTSNLQFDLLFDYLEGLAGGPSELENQLKRRSKVFFVGNTFFEFVSGEGKDRKTRTDIAQKLDEALDQLSQTMDVYILPGERDPTGPMLPQVPLHRCVFPKASRRPTFTALTNPARLEIPITAKNAGPKLDILFSSGQNVTDVIRNCDINSTVEAAEHLLRWGHICPTGPDTLPLHPGAKDDVFVLNSMPDIFAIGNQDSFDTLEWKSTKILSIPKYSETGTVVLVNNELSFVPVSFKLL